MTAKQTKDGWRVDFRAGGANGKRYRKTCRTKAEAERYQKFVEAQHIANGKPWNEKPTDNRLLSELVELWSEHFGRRLINYKKRRQKLDRVVERLGDPIASKLSRAAYSSYATERINEGIKPETVNESLKFINAVYNGLHRLDVIDYENPLKCTARIKQKQTERPFLTVDQMKGIITALESSDTPEVALIVRICLATGARWGEADGITSSNLANNSITFVGTKNGKNRTLPLDPALYAELQAQSKRVGGGKLFRLKQSFMKFNKALTAAKIELPKGQKTHVLRHSYASHFMINGGNILTLQKILDHSDIKLTMIYAHLAPNHLQEALLYAPLHTAN